jgi:hypothetical protein
MPVFAFLATILQLTIPKTRLNSIPSSYLGRLASRISTLHSILDYCSVLSHVFRLCPFITSWHGPHRKQPLLLRKSVNGPLPSNGYSSVACVRFTGMCLPSRCLAMGIQVIIICSPIFSTIDLVLLNERLGLNGIISDF